MMYNIVNVYWNNYVYIASYMYTLGYHPDPSHPIFNSPSPVPCIHQRVSRNLPESPESRKASWKALDFP